MVKVRKDIQKIARTYTQSAVKTLVGIMQQPKSPPAARVQAAQIILDRGWGKAPQSITGENGSGPVRIEVTRVIVNPGDGALVIEHDAGDDGDDGDDA